MAATAHECVPEVRLDQPRAAGRVGLSAEHRRHPAVDEPAHVSAHAAGAGRGDALAQQMNWRAAFAALSAALLATVLSGCSSIPFLSKKTEGPAVAASPDRAVYALEVEAPDDLRKLLL